MRLKKKTNFNHTVFFGVVEEGAGGGGVGGVRTWKTLGGGGKFCLGNTYKAGGWVTCNCLSTWACFN